MLSLGGEAVPGATALVGLKRDKEPQQIARALSGAGWRVTLAPNARSLLDIANLELPDLVVVDAALDRLDDDRHPAEALGSLGARGHRPKIVLVARQRDRATLALAATARADTVLVVRAGRAPGTTPQPTGGEGRRRTLWVVDDSTATRVLVRSAFERAGWQVEEFADLGSALSSNADRGAPDAVLLDIHLPDGNGLRHVSDFALAGAAVIVLSNLAGADQVERAFSAGAIDIVAKPFDLRSLVARVERSLRWTPPSPNAGARPAARAAQPNAFSTQWL